MRLTATTHTLELVTSSGADVEYTIDYHDMVTSPAFTPGSTQGTITTATDTTVLTAPAVSTYRRVVRASFRNIDASLSNTVTVQKDVSGTEYRVVTATLAAGEVLSYEEGAGWYVMDSTGRHKHRDFVIAPVPAASVPPTWTNATPTATRTITTTNTMWTYIGKAPTTISTSAVMHYRITTAMATITWGEIAIATGTPAPGSNPSLTVKGYADVSAIANSTGIKRTTINMSSGQTINEGDDVWVGLGNQATTAAVVRAGGADDLESGCSASGAQRPSLIVGTPTAFTVDTTGAVPFFRVFWG